MNVSEVTLVAAGAGIAGVIATLAIRSRAQRAALERARATADDARERRYNLLEAIPDGVYTLDESLHITHINEEAERLLDADARPFVGRPIESMLSPLASDLVPEIRHARATGETISRVAHFGGTGWWIEIRILPAANETVIYLRDVTVRKRAETRLLESEARLRMLMEQVPAVLWSVDRSERFVSISGAGLVAFGFTESMLLGRAWPAFVGGSDASSRLPADVFAGRSVQFETPAGDRWLRHHVEPLRDAGGTVVGAVGVSLDISEIKVTREKLESAARIDALTQLPNRFALEEVLTEALADSGADAICAVLFVDLDRFKTINDTLGHRVGDEVLRVVADRLRSSVDQDDVVARPGGDEFIVVLRSIASLDNVGAVAARLLRRFEEPIFTAGRQLFVKGSIGAAIAPQHGASAEALIKNADAAMYHAKDAGRGTFCFYDSDLEQANLARLHLEGDLRHALERGEFRLEYQPIVDVSGGQVTGCEALLRWNHPDLGRLQPDAFIRLAEEAGFIGDITRWVLGEACRFGAAMRLRRPDFRVTVNVAPSDLRDGGIFGVVREQLAAARLAPDGLEIEVTENALLDDAAIVALEALRKLGVSIAVDDFGTAYNSLLYLKRLPVTTLKIDRVFLEGVVRDGFDRSIVQAIVMLGRSLAMRVIAEGIESREQWRFVSELACNEAQGFWFSRAVGPDAFEALLLAPPHPRGAVRCESSTERCGDGR